MSRGADLVAAIQRTARALDDLANIYERIAVDRPNAARKVLQRLDPRIKPLALQPRSGAARSDIRPGLRMAVVAPYFILYEIDPDEDDAPVESVTVVRIVDSRRDLTEVV